MRELCRTGSCGEGSYTEAHFLYSQMFMMICEVPVVADCWASLETWDVILDCSVTEEMGYTENVSCLWEESYKTACSLLS